MNLKTIMKMINAAYNNNCKIILIKLKKTKSKIIIIKIII